MSKYTHFYVKTHDFAYLSPYSGLSLTYSCGSRVIEIHTQPYRLAGKELYQQSLRACHAECKDSVITILLPSNQTAKTKQLLHNCSVFTVQQYISKRIIRRY